MGKGSWVARLGGKRGIVLLCLVVGGSVTLFAGYQIDAFDSCERTGESARPSHAVFDFWPPGHKCVFDANKILGLPGLTVGPPPLVSAAFILLSALVIGCLAWWVATFVRRAPRHSSDANAAAGASG